MPRLDDEYEVEVVWNGQSSRSLLTDFPAQKSNAFREAEIKFGVSDRHPNRRRPVDPRHRAVHAEESEW